ncbi:MAG: exodeoxyribonuclease VII large subunit [Acidimicrobiales bacterium]
MPETMSVEEVCHALERTIDDRFPDEVWIRGAISGLNRSSNGHVYFDLIEPGELGRRPEAVLPVALFAKHKFRVNAILKKSGRIRMEDGIEIRVRGRLTFYPPQSRMQLLMTLIDPSFTLGQLEVARTQLLATLHAEGIIEANRRLAAPALPLRVAVITSAASAAEADFLHELRASGLPFHVQVIDSRVQGPEAVPMIVASLAEAVDHAPDVIAIVRGGGSRTDLMAFDHEEVARAIALSPIPVFVGIGHEIDLSVADHVAHLTTKTPTACAAAIVERVRAFVERVDDAEHRLIRVAIQQLDREERRLLAAGNRIGRLAGGNLERERSRLALLEHRVSQSTRRVIERNGDLLERQTLRTNALDPAVTLARGWSITRRADGHLVRSPADAPPGTTLVTSLADGTLTSTTITSTTITSTTATTGNPGT